MLRVPFYQSHDSYQEMAILSRDESPLAREGLLQRVIKMDLNPEQLKHVNLKFALLATRLPTTLYKFQKIQVLIGIETISLSLEAQVTIAFIFYFQYII